MYIDFASPDQRTSESLKAIPPLPITRIRQAKAFFPKNRFVSDNRDRNRGNELCRHLLLNVVPDIGKVGLMFLRGGSGLP